MAAIVVYLATGEMNVIAAVDLEEGATTIDATIEDMDRGPFPHEETAHPRADVTDIAQDHLTGETEGTETITMIVIATEATIPETATEARAVTEEKIDVAETMEMAHARNTEMTRRAD